MPLQSRSHSVRNAFDLSGRRILITGAAAGIGAATALICAGLGAEVILVDMNDSVDIARSIERDGGRAEVAKGDAADRAFVEGLVHSYGPVDALVLNAALCPWDEEWNAPDWDESFARVMDINVLGPIHAVRAFLPRMIERRRGNIVLVGSLAGRMGGLIAGPHYVASKGGIHALTKWLARQGAPHGIIVNAVAPASVETPLMQDRPVDLARIPLGRKAHADEVAWPIAFLCSDAASYICGTVIDVNGGVYMS